MVIILQSILLFFLLASTGEAGGGAVVGRVLEADGSAVVAEVILWRRRGDDDNLPKVVSDADGGFALRDLEAGAGWLLVRTPRRMALANQVVVPLTGELDLGVVVLPAAAEVVGQVVTDVGERLAGATVTAVPNLPVYHSVEAVEGPLVTTDDEGRFVLPGIPPSDVVKLQIEAEGFRSVRGSWAVTVEESSSRLESPLVLSRSGRIAVRVVGEDGEPVTTATVWAVVEGTSPDMLVSQSVDEAGRFVFEGLPLVPHFVQASARAHTGDSGVVAPAASDLLPEKLELTLRRLPAADLEVRVVDAEGATVEQAELSLSCRGEGWSSYDHGATDEIGTVFFAEVPRGGRCEARLEHPAQPRTGREDLVLTGAAMILAFDRAPWRIVEVEGSVAEADGSPVGAGQVSLDRVVCCGHYTATLDPGGGFYLASVKEGAYRLAFRAGGRSVKLASEVLREPVEELRLVLPRVGVVEGTLSGLPEEWLRAVRVTAREEHGVQSVVALSEGRRFRLERVPAGSWLVTAHQDEQVASAAVEVREDEVAEVELVFPEAFELQGLILIDGAPHPGQPLSLVRSAPDDGSFRAPTRTDGRGRFVYTGLQTGRYKLGFYSRRGSVAREIEIIADTEITLDLETLMLAGRVLDAETGAPIFGAALDAFGEAMMTHGPEFRARSEEGGSFSLGPVIDGSWGFSIKADGYEDFYVHPRPLAGAHEDLRFELVPARTLRLRIVTLQPRLPRTVEINLFRDQPREFKEKHVSVDENALAAWVGAPPGRWRLSVSDGFSWFRQEVVIPGPEVVVSLGLAGALQIEVPALSVEAQQGVTGRTRLVARLLQADDPSFAEPARVELERGRSRGVFGLRSLVPGLWSVTVKGSDGRSWAGQAVVADHQRSTLVLRGDG